MRHNIVAPDQGVVLDQMLQKLILHVVFQQGESAQGHCGQHVHPAQIAPKQGKMFFELGFKVLNFCRGSHEGEIHMVGTHKNTVPDGPGLIGLEGSIDGLFQNGHGGEVRGNGQTTGKEKGNKGQVFHYSIVAGKHMSYMRKRGSGLNPLVKSFTSSASLVNQITSRLRFVKKLSNVAAQRVSRETAKEKPRISAGPVRGLKSAFPTLIEENHGPEAEEASQRGHKDGAHFAVGIREIGAEGDQDDDLKQDSENGDQDECGDQSQDKKREFLHKKILQEKHM